jgi:hypothetical protein
MRHYFKEKEKSKVLMRKFTPGSERQTLPDQRAEYRHSQGKPDMARMVAPSSEPIERPTLGWSSSSAVNYDRYNLLSGVQQGSDTLAILHSSSSAEHDQGWEPLPDIDIIPRQSFSPVHSNLLAFPTQRREIELIHHCRSN